MEKISAITVNPEIQDGAPVFAGTRIRLETFYDYMRIGVTVNEFLNEFPSLTRDQVMEVYQLAKKKYSLEQIKRIAQGAPLANLHQQQQMSGRVFSQPVGMR